MPGASCCPVYLIKGEQIRFKKLDVHLLNMEDAVFNNVIFGKKLHTHKFFSTLLFCAGAKVVF